MKGLKSKARAHEAEITSLNSTLRSKHYQSLEVTALRNEVKQLNDGLRATTDRTKSLQSRVEELEAEIQEDAPITEVGREVRLRVVEKYRLRLHQRIGDRGHKRIKTGDRAAHRGRAIADARLYRSGDMSHDEAYRRLYGFKLEAVLVFQDVPEVADVAGYHDSLESEGWLEPKFREPFQESLKLLVVVSSSTPAY